MYDVITVPSGRTALQFLDMNTCDLILLDVDMPTMDGIETLKNIREKENGMIAPVMFLTADKSAKTVIEGANLGIMGYITKPFEFDDLRNRIADVLEKYSSPIGSNEIYDRLLDVLKDLRKKQGTLAIPKIVEILNRMK